MAKNDALQFDDYVKRNILAVNEFGIKEILGLKTLSSLAFFHEEYSRIAVLIKENKIDEMSALTEYTKRGDEYLYIMTFTDQSNNKYIVTVYDSDALEQDSQVIEICAVTS